MNPSEIIYINPVKANKEALEWSRVAAKFPEASLYQEQLFISWAERYKNELTIDPKQLWEGKEITDAFLQIMEAHEKQQMQTQGSIDLESYPPNINYFLLPTLVAAFRNKSRLIEDDPRFKKLADEQKEIWKKENNKDDFNSEEGVNYLYGNPNDPKAPNLKKDIKSLTEADPKKKELFEKLEQKYAKEKIKIYKKAEDDPRITRTKELIEEEAKARFEVLKKQDVTQTLEEVHEKVKTKRWGEFVKEHPQKTKAYLEKHEEIKKAVDSLENQKKQVPNKNPSPINKQPINIKDFKNRRKSWQREQREEDVVINKHSGHTYDPDTGRVEIREIGQSHDTPPIEVIETRTPRRTPSQPSSDNMPQPSQPSPAGQPHKGGGGPPRRGGGAKGMPGGLPNIGNLSKLGKMAKFAPFFLNPYVWAGILILIFLLTFIGVWQGLNNTSPIETNPQTGGDISGCTFYRGGDSQSGLKYANPQMATVVSDISAKVGVPETIIAGIMRVESPDAFRSTDPTYITNDYEAKFSKDDNGNPVAYGIMQFTPNTFLNTYNVNSADLRTLFAKTDLKIGIDPQTNMAPSNFFRIYSIRDSITAAAFKVKGDKKIINGDGPWDETTIRGIAERYYGTSKNYDSNGNNYGSDLWKSFQNCQISSSPEKNIPLSPDGIHACVSPENFIAFPGNYSNIGKSQYSYVCGHCSPIYNAIDTGVNSEGGSPIIAVTDGVVEDDSNPIGGTALWLTGDDKLNYYYAHLKKEGLITGRVKAGQVIGYIASASETKSGNNGIAHVHFSAGTPGNKQSFNDPANVPAGPLLDSWCGNNVCNGKPNANYNCGQY